MRKRKSGRKFGREKDQRKALMKALISALILNEKIITTQARAKEMRSFAEKLITATGKKDRLTAKRYANQFLNPKLAKKLVEEIAPRYKERPGGYTRIIRLGQRQSDGAKMVIIELVK